MSNNLSKLAGVSTVAAAAAVAEAPKWPVGTDLNWNLPLRTANSRYPVVILSVADKGDFPIIATVDEGNRVIASNFNVAGEDQNRDYEIENVPQRPSQMFAVIHVHEDDNFEDSGITGPFATREAAQAVIGQGDEDTHVVSFVLPNADGSLPSVSEHEEEDEIPVGTLGGETVENGEAEGGEVVQASVKIGFRTYKVGDRVAFIGGRIPSDRSRSTRGYGSGSSPRYGRITKVREDSKRSICFLPDGAETAYWALNKNLR